MFIANCNEYVVCMTVHLRHVIIVISSHSFSWLYSCNSSLVVHMFINVSLYCRSILIDYCWNFHSYTSLAFLYSVDVQYYYYIRCSWCFGSVVSQILMAVMPRMLLLDYLNCSSHLFLTARIWNITSQYILVLILIVIMLSSGCNTYVS